MLPEGLKASSGENGGSYIIPPSSEHRYAAGVRADPNLINPLASNTSVKFAADLSSSSFLSASSSFIGVTDDGGSSAPLQQQATLTSSPTTQLPPRSSMR
ncbi:hypothetical protein Q8A73_012651 [Channa argus]|nr:hypothetical protein Q8A73_012651 [Channa argus]